MTGVVTAAVGAVSLVGVSSASAAEPVRIFAAPSGSGSVCTVAAPCSLDGAVARVVAEQAGMSSDVVVYLRGGRYSVTSPIELGAQHSGVNGHRVIFRNYPDESPVLSGGREITGWTQGADGLWSADAQGLSFFQLYGDGLMFTRARTEKVQGSRWTVPGTRQLAVRVPASLVPDEGISDLTGVQVRIMHTWRELRYPIEQLGEIVDPDHDPQQVLDLAEPISRRSDGKTGENDIAPAGDPIQKDLGEAFLEGAKEFITDEGEWYLDSAADRVYLKSPVDPDTLNVIAPVTRKLLAISGAEHITVYGLQFAHTSWNEPLVNGNFQRQGGIHMKAQPKLNDPTSQGVGKWYVNPAAVRIGDSHDIRFQRNGFRDTGANAVNLDKGTEDVTFIANIFNRLSDSGVWVGTDQEPLPAEADRNVNTVVKNNVFHEMGRTYATDSAITMTYPHGATIAHNDIRDVNNIAINIGWFNVRRETVETALQDVHVTANRIEGVCLTADDCAGWHSLQHYKHGDDGQGGTIPRSTVSRNYIINAHDNPLTVIGKVHALYLDAKTDGLVVTENEWDDVDGGIKDNTAGSNTVTNNNREDEDVQNSAGLEAAYRFLLNIDLDTDSVGAARGPHPTVPS